MNIEDLEEKHIEEDLPNPSTDLVIEEELNVEIHEKKMHRRRNSYSKY